MVPVGEEGLEGSGVSRAELRGGHGLTQGGGEVGAPRAMASRRREVGEVGTQGTDGRRFLGAETPGDEGCLDVLAGDVSTGNPGRAYGRFYPPMALLGAGFRRRVRE